ncbi:hypothetical protein ACVXZ0_18280 [Staphylococcus aureus]
MTSIYMKVVNSNTLTSDTKAISKNAKDLLSVSKNSGDLLDKAKERANNLNIEENRNL